MDERNWETKQNINDIERARMLRREAIYLEQKEKVKSRLEYLMGISEDAEYDRYLTQMLKDLESGKASPAQVEKEAQRSYGEYRQKMARAQSQRLQAESQLVRQTEESYDRSHHRNSAAIENAPKSTIEFKIGVHVFSITGAVFVLAAFVIMGFHFLGGLAQGLCLYGAALALVILSEFVFGKKILKRLGEHGNAFNGVLTGAGIGGLYAANIINYLVLDTISGIVAMLVTLLIAVSTVFISRKRDSEAIRIFSLIGCYICFFPVRGFETEFNFLLIAGILLVVNLICIFFPNRKYQGAVDAVHILLVVLFTTMLMGIAWTERINSVYLAGYVTTTFLFINIFSLKKCMGKETELFPACCIGNAVQLILLFFIGNFGPGLSKRPDMALFIHLTVEALIFAVCLATFVLWDKEDGRRWAQLYYVAGTVLLLGSFSEYPLEILLSGLTVLLAAVLASGYKENLVLSCFVAAWAGILAFRLSDCWYCWLLAVALLFAAVCMKRVYLYQEFLSTAVILLIWRIRFHFYIGREFNLEAGWFYLMSAVVLLVLFLLFNHLPWRKGKIHRPYNIVNMVITAFFYLGVWFCYSSVFSSAMMALGAVTIFIVFRDRYGLGTKWKYLILAGFLTWFSLTGHYESPVTVSILLMVIALGCVGIGFKLEDKAERIYGLVMAAFVCLKLVLYDFREVETIYRVMVFLIVGIIALIISFIYVRLEKNMVHREEEKNVDSDSEIQIENEI